MAQPSKNTPCRPFSVRRKAVRWLTMPFALLAFLIILFEEWIWKKASLAMQSFGRLPWVCHCEQKLKEAPAWVAVFAFFIPAIILFPAKLGGLWLITHHHAILGALVFLGAKIVGAACLARVYSLTEASLRSVHWINVLLTFVICKKDALKKYVLNSSPLRRAQGFLSLIQIRFKRVKASWSEKRMKKALRRQRRLSSRP